MEVTFTDVYKEHIKNVKIIMYCAITKQTQLLNLIFFLSLLVTFGETHK